MKKPLKGEKSSYVHKQVTFLLFAHYLHLKFFPVFEKKQQKNKLSDCVFDVTEECQN